MKVAVVLFNLGGPDSPEAVEPFLRNLFTDPAIIGAPGFIRRPLARLIARRRAPVAREIYGRIGGRSPILPQTEAQARALERVLAERRADTQFRAFVSMRYWHPLSDVAARAVKAWNPDRVVLLPLYPQMSTTTSESSVKDWLDAAGRAGIKVPTQVVCCYPTQTGFIDAATALIREAIDKVGGQPFRLLFSAHGLPENVIRRGDPYQWQVEQSAQAIVQRLALRDLDWSVCYQSRVGPMKWIGPSTDAEIQRTGRDGKAVVLFPVAFVSEHSETLVELDIEYRELAHKSAVPAFHRVATVGIHDAFIGGLANLVEGLLSSPERWVTNDGAFAACPAQHRRCPLTEQSRFASGIRPSSPLWPAAAVAGLAAVAVAAHASDSDPSTSLFDHTFSGGSTSDHSDSSYGSGDTYSSDSGSSSSDSGSSSGSTE
jgi:protoporphyrin/coproporphyrin ferrochelatase